MRTRSRRGRPSRLRKLAVGSAVLVGLIYAGGTLTSTTAKAATTDKAATAAACGVDVFFFLPGQELTLLAQNDSVEFDVSAETYPVGNGVGGWVSATYDTPGEPWRAAANTALSTTAGTTVDDYFTVGIGLDTAANAYYPEIGFSGCGWDYAFHAPSVAGAAPAPTSAASAAEELAALNVEEETIDSIYDGEIDATTADPGDDDGYGFVISNNDYSDDDGVSDDGGDDGDD
jgi:hypothetical protein